MAWLTDLLSLAEDLWIRVLLVLDLLRLAKEHLSLGRVTVLLLILAFLSNPPMATLLIYVIWASLAMTPLLLLTLEIWDDDGAGV